MGGGVAMIFARGDDRLRMLGRGDLERGRVIGAMVDWLTIRYREQVEDGRQIAPKTIEALLSALEADIAHSSLLFRLLDGKKALPKPPPRMFSYPAYDLVEGPGPFPLVDVHFEPEPSDQVLIGQAWWRVIGRPKEATEHPTWWVEWPGRRGEPYDLWMDKATGRWSMKRMADQ